MLSKLKGLLLIAFAISLAIACTILWLHSLLLIILKMICSILSATIAVMAADSGLGMLMFKHEELKFKTINKQHVNHHAFLVSGYNGNGPVVLGSFATVLANNNCAGHALHRTTKRFNLQQVVDAYYEQIMAHKPDKLTLYVESMGGRVFVELMMRHPDLYVDSLVLNAALTCGNDAVCPRWIFRLLGRLHGGPLTTLLFRWQMKKKVKSDIAPDGTVNPQIISKYQQDRIMLTAPVSFDQINLIGAASALPDNALIGRVGNAIFLRAPEPKDRLIKTQQALNNWRRLFGPKVEVIDTPVMAWSGKLHVPISRFGAVMQAIEKAVSA